MGVFANVKFISVIKIVIFYIKLVQFTEEFYIFGSRNGAVILPTAWSVD